MAQPLHRFRHRVLHRLDDAQKNFEQLEGMLQSLTGFNVMDFGALGDGVTDDAPAIQTAILALVAAGGGTLYFPPGTYLVKPFLNPAGVASYYSGVWIPSNVVLKGAGKRASIIKLVGSLNTTGMTSCTIVSNLHVDASTVDKAGATEDIGVDGNGANQSGTNYAEGIRFMRCDGYEVRRTRVKNVYGTASSGAGETFHCYFELSGNGRVLDSEVVDDAGSSASGFGDIHCTDMHYANSYATGSTNGAAGFCTFNGQNTTYSHCDSFLNPSGFNFESGSDAVLDCCHAGGLAANSSGSSPKPYTDAENLGNTAYGVISNQSRVRIANSDISQNDVGIVCTGANASIEVSNNNVEGNTTSNYQFIGGASALNSSGIIAAGQATITWPGTVTRSTLLNINHTLGFAPNRVRATGWLSSGGGAHYIVNTASTTAHIQLMGVSTEGGPTAGVTALVDYEIEF